MCIRDSYKAVVKEILDSRKENGGIHAIYFAACGGSKAGLTTADFLLKCESATIDSHVYTAKEVLPVSYTHLDVYKRQIQLLPFMLTVWL